MSDPWKPANERNFVYPYTERVEKGKKVKRYLTMQYLSDKFNCFDYSRTEKGLFCTPCVIFGNRQAGGVGLQTLVTNPFTNYTKLSDKLKKHISTVYHQQSVVKGNEFLKAYESGINVCSMANSAHSKEQEENHRKLTRIIVAIEHHGRLGAPLRGHRDSGTINLDPNLIVYTERQFRATL